MTNHATLRNFPLRHLAKALAANLPDVRVEAYDGSCAGPDGASTAISINSPAALAQLIRAPRGLGLARAWVTGQIDVQGDWQTLITCERMLRQLRTIGPTLISVSKVIPQLRLADLKVTGPTSAEYRQRRPGKHSIERDIAETNFHYGLDPEYYKLILGPTITYSGGIFEHPGETLEEAQTNKHRIVCRKLGLGSSDVLLDVGCGWASLIRYATLNSGCSAIGLTASRSQYETARQLVSTHDANIIYGDYRDVLPITGVTAAVSVGMYEHVGINNSSRFFQLIRACLKPGSLYLNQAIVRSETGPKSFRRNSFVQRYIFPNGQLLPLSRQLRDMEAVGFTPINIDRYGDSYALTIGKWLANLERYWRDCARLVGEQKVRAWYIYLLGAKARFDTQAIDLVQVTAEAR